MQANIAVIPGDFVGPEVTAECLKVLKAVSERFGHSFAFHEVLAGGAAYDAYGEHLPQATVDACLAAQAVIKGPFGGPPQELNHPKWARVERDAILALRNRLGLFANLRPTLTRAALLDSSPIRRERIEGVDLLIVRELMSGIYFGPKLREQVDGEEQATDIELYRVSEIKRIGELAFQLAKRRRRKVTLVAKSNVLISSVLWREVIAEVAGGHPDVELDYLHVDNAAMQLIINPRQFDVLLTSNLFGDILSDEAGAVAGSIGVMPSASLNASKFGLYEPIHGSAPDIAGKDAANPIGQILSGAEMLRHTFGLEPEAQAIYDAVDAVLNDGYRTGDLMGSGDGRRVGTREMGDRIVEKLLA